jgi:hypothetical protein
MALFSTFKLKEMEEREVVDIAAIVTTMMLLIPWIW